MANLSITRRRVHGSRKAGTFVAAPLLAQEADNQSDSGLQSVTVTARYVQENLQTTPLAITAITGDALEERQLTNVTDLGHAVPNLFITPGDANVGPTPTVAMRGVSASDYSFLRLKKASSIFFDFLE